MFGSGVDACGFWFLVFLFFPSFLLGWAGVRMSVKAIDGGLKGSKGVTANVIWSPALSAKLNIVFVCEIV